MEWHAGTHETTSYAVRKNSSGKGVWEGAQLHASGAVLDGELAVTDPSGETIFQSMFRGREDVRYLAFDLMWCNGQDLRANPLLARKRMLKRTLPVRAPLVLYVDHVHEHGTLLYRLACAEDLEGIIAKRAESTYRSVRARSSPWIKIKNLSYSQKAGRAEWCNRSRDPRNTR